MIRPPHDGHTIDVGPVHVLTHHGGPCADYCPHPDHQPQPGPRYGGYRRLDNHRIITHRNPARLVAAATRVAAYIARREARAMGFTPGALVDVRTIDDAITNTIAVRAEIETTRPV